MRWKSSDEVEILRLSGILRCSGNLHTGMIWKSSDEVEIFRIIGNPQMTLKSLDDAEIVR